MVTLAEELAQIDNEIEKLEDRRREIYKLSLEAPAAEKVCANYLAEMCSEEDLFPQMEWPITVSGIHWAGDPYWNSKGEPKLVAVRPVGDDKTYLGIHIGEIALGSQASHHPESGVLSLESTHHNPAIVVPSLKRIVMGAESWWGLIKSEDELKKITDEDIDNIWYVQALLKLNEGE